jgi:hypothetical protein
MVVPPLDLPPSNVTICVTGQINGTGLLGKRIHPLPSTFTPVFFSELIKRNNSLDEKLISGCNGDKQCIYDTLATGNADTGHHTQMIFGTYQLMNTTLSKRREAQEGISTAKKQIWAPPSMTFL